MHRSRLDSSFTIHRGTVGGGTFERPNGRGLDWLSG